MSFCTYCVWKHPGQGRTGFSCRGPKTMLGNPRLASAQYCVLWPSTKFALCSPGASPARDRHD